MANKDRATNPPPEKPGGEGWLVSPEQQLLSVQIRHGDRPSASSGINGRQ